MSYLPIRPTLLDWGNADANVMTGGHDITTQERLPGQAQVYTLLPTFRLEEADVEGKIAFLDLLKLALAETVDERKQRIFALRYGWSELPPQSFSSIGKLLERHGASVTRLHDTTVRKLWMAGQLQQAGKKPSGACGRLYRMLQEAVRPREADAHSRVAQFAALHLPTLPQKRVAQRLVRALLLMPREKPTFVKTK